MCTGQACGAATITLWREVQTMVYQARELAGRRFMDARSMTDAAARTQALQAIVSDLRSLQERFQSRSTATVWSRASKR